MIEEESMGRHAPFIVEQDASTGFLIDANLQNFEVTLDVSQEHSGYRPIECRVLGVAMIFRLETQDGLERSAAEPRSDRVHPTPVRNRSFARCRHTHVDRKDMLCHAVSSDKLV